jgi:DNA helicase-2/ATP-dependent DNA helicase PcrA
MRRVIQTEVDVSLEKDGYILTGKVDLLLGGDGKLELLDFKTSPRPKDSPELIAAYERQLCTYATSWSGATAGAWTGCCCTGPRSHASRMR